MWEHCFNYVFVVACVVDVPGLAYLNVCVSSVSVCLSYCFLRVITSQKCLSIMTINLICDFFPIVYYKCMLSRVYLA